MYKVYQLVRDNERNSNNILIYNVCVDWDSPVGIATPYGVFGPTHLGRDIRDLKRLTPWPTQPPVQWVTGVFSRGKSGRSVVLTIADIDYVWSYRFNFLSVRDGLVTGQHYLISPLFLHI
jgi:hypothetical protein